MFHISTKFNRILCNAISISMTPQYNPQQDRVSSYHRPKCREETDTAQKIPYQLVKELKLQCKVSACAFSLYHFAIGCENGNVIVYELTSWKVYRTYYRRKKVRIVRFSPCSQYLGVGSDDGTVALIYLEKDSTFSQDGNDDEVSANIIKRDALIHALSFSPHGNELVFGGFDGIVAIANVTELGINVARELSSLGVILSLDYSPCGKYIAIGGSDMCVTIVESKSFSEVARFKRLSSVQCVEWHPSGEWVAAGGRDGIVAVYDFTSKTLKKEIFPSSSKRVLCAGWNLDGSIMAIGGTDEFISIFETVGFEAVQEIPRVGHVTCLAFHKQFFAVGEKGSKICIFRNPVLNSEYRRQKPDLDNKTLVKVHLGSSPLRNSETLGTSECLSLNLARSWSRPEILKFLQISEDFLGKCTLEPSSSMSTISFLTAVRMLRHYLQRIRVLEDDRNEIALSLKNDSDFVQAICRILLSSIEAIERNTIRKFNIPAKDTRRVQVWNVKWRRTRIVDPPFLDVDLLRSVDSPSSKEDAIDTNTLGDLSFTSLSGSIDTVEESIITFHNTKDNQTILDTIADASTVDYSEASKCVSKPTKISNTWADVNEPCRFLQACKIFLAPFENDSPPSHLRYFVSAILMLQCHVQWVNSSLSKDHETRIMQRANTLPIFCQVLKCFATAMVSVSSNPPDTFSSLSSILNFRLSSKDIKSLHEWNSIFKSSHNEYLPLVDISLMETIIDDLTCEVVQSNYDLNSIDANIEHSVMSYLNDEIKGNTKSDEDCASPTSILDLVHGTSEETVEQNIDRHNESSQANFVSNLLWSSPTVEPHFKPVHTDEMHTASVPSFPPTTSSKKRSSITKNKLNSSPLDENIHQTKNIDITEIKASSRSSYPPTKRSTHLSSSPTSKPTNFSRLFSRLKTNLAKDSDRSISSRSFRTSKSQQVSTHDNNNQRSNSLKIARKLNSKNQPTSLIQARSSISDAPKKRLSLSFVISTDKQRRSSFSSKQPLPQKNQEQLEQQQQHKSHQGSNKNRKQKPRLVVSHIPSQILRREDNACRQ